MVTLPIERKIAKELKIKVAQIMEWSTGEIEPQGEEIYIFLKDLGVHVCYKKKENKK